MKRLIPVIVTVILMAMVGSALAVPRLQTYIVGSKYYGFYRQEAMSWVTQNSSFDMRVVGYWQPAGGSCGLLGGRSAPAYDYLDCYLMMAVPQDQSGTIWVNGIEITSFTPYASALPSDINPNPSLRNHAPAGMARMSFLDIGRIDNNQVGAHEYSPFFGMCNPGWGDEILLKIVVSGYSWTHFDAAGVDSRGITYVNPYSHDASYYTTPEPGTLSLLGLGLLGMIPILKRAKR